MERLSITRGDARELTATLTLDVVDWDIPVGATVRVTGKARRTDADDDAVFTKATGGNGVTVADNIATITLAPADTDGIATGSSPVTLYCDVQVSGPGIGPWTVNKFLLVVEPDVTRTP